MILIPPTKIRRKALPFSLWELVEFRKVHIRGFNSEMICFMVFSQSAERREHGTEVRRKALSAWREKQRVHNLKSQFRCFNALRSALCAVR